MAPSCELEMSLQPELCAGNLLLVSEPSARAASLFVVLLPFSALLNGVASPEKLVCWLIEDNWMLTGSVLVVGADDGVDLG